MTTPAGNLTNNASATGARRHCVALLAIFFLVAQLAVAVHNSTIPGALENHSSLSCALCLAGAGSDDPHGLEPSLAAATGAFLDCRSTAIPAAQLTQIAVRAAAPRGPPLS